MPLRVVLDSKTPIEWKLVGKNYWDFAQFFSSYLVLLLVLSIKNASQTYYFVSIPKKKI